MKRLFRFSIYVLGFMFVVSVVYPLIDPEGAEELREERELREKREAEEQAIEAAKREEQAERDKLNGFHCLSSWDGSHPGFKRQVKDVMRDPDSFEHIETRVGPLNDGQHTISMQYRARNGFGGMNVGLAHGLYSHDTCDATVTIAE